MSDDHTNHAHIWRDLVPVWLETASSQPQATPLAIGNKSERELLEEMLVEVRRLSDDAHKTEAEWLQNMANKCAALLELFLVRSEHPITDADPLNLAMLFYEYGRLTMPSSERDLALSSTARHHVASVKRHKNGSGRGGNKGGRTNQENAAKRMAEGKRRYDRLVAAGIPERNAPSRVASEMGVTAQVVRTWRKAGWKNKTKE